MPPYETAYRFLYNRFTQISQEIQNHVDITKLYKTIRATIHSYNEMDRHPPSPACVLLEPLYPDIVDDFNSSFDEIFDVVDDFEDADGRRASFVNGWPTYFNIDKFVSAGFYYTGVSDRVKCPHCNLHLTNWCLQHNPTMIHRKFSGPTCPFVRFDYDMEAAFYFDKWSLEDMHPIQDLKHPQHRRYESRVETFKDHPVIWLPGRYFAEAGFFCTGNYDETTCFDCGLTLNCWEDHEDPWEIHALSMPDCRYITTIKGSKYPKYLQRALRTYYPPFKTEEMDQTKEENADLNGGNFFIPIENSRTCITCRKEESVIFKPCGHLVACYECVDPLKKKCPLCYQRIQYIAEL